MSKVERDEAVLNFVEQILHGDDEHKAWLRAAAAAYIAGIWPLPKEAGGSTKDRRIAALTAALDEAEKALDRRSLRDDLLALCDPSNWDQDMKGDEYRGYFAAMEAVHQAVMEHWDEFDAKSVPALDTIRRVLGGA